MATRLEQCRVCYAPLQELWELGDFALTGIFPEPGEPVDVEPMGLSYCRNCTLVQMHYSYEQQLYGPRYGYRSSLNPSMVKHLNGVALSARQHVEIRPSDVVVDIGGNDGTLIANFDCERVVIDPSQERLPIDAALVSEPFSKAAYLKATRKKAKAVFSVAMFYDLADPVRFAQDVADILRPDGIWVLEQSYLPLMLKNNAFDTICHEHLEYYTLRSLNEILVRAGLNVIDVCFNGTNGGSFRVFAGKRTGIPLQYESQDIEGSFRALRERVDAIGKRLRRVLRPGYCGYGASTKGNTLLQYYDLKPRFIVDVNPDKWGKVTPGTNIPICPPTGEDEQYLVLPWHFRDYILENEVCGQYVFPLPEVKEYGLNNLD